LSCFVGKFQFQNRHFNHLNELICGDGYGGDAFSYDVSCAFYDFCEIFQRKVLQEFAHGPLPDHCSYHKFVERKSLAVLFAQILLLILLSGF
jgi:hypothetical protein